MIVRAKVVVTIDGPPIEDGAVAISGEKIIDLGKYPEVTKRHSEEVVDLGEQALLPGLINAHCHLDYTCLRGKIPRQKSFTDWIRAINGEKAKLSPDNYIASINEGFLEAKRFGTTTMLNLTAFPELVSQIAAPIRTWWLTELIDVRDPSRANEIVDLAVEQLKSQEHWGLAPHAPYTASTNLFRRCDKIAPLVSTHLAESREEMEMFCEARGPLYDFLSEIGRDMRDCGDETPAEKFLIEWICQIDKPCLLVHLNEMAESDFELFAVSKAKFSVVHCPRSHEYFGHSPFQFQKLRKLGFNVCLGTDSLASNQDLSLFAEMRAFQKEFPKVSPEEILKMVTVNPARALRQEIALGKIRAGFFADLIALPVTRSTSAIEEIIAFDRPVRWSMIGGRISA
jgi:cytosine/adenosine deaminase-related metal-dependent hydrolase